MAPLTSPSSLIVTDGKIGDLVQCRGVAEAMGLEPVERIVAPRFPWAWIAPYGPGDPRERPASLGAPYPDIAIGSGRRAVPFLRGIKGASKGRTFTICLKDSRVGERAADFTWVPSHDDLRGRTVMVTLTSPHTLSQERIAAARAELAEDIAALPSPRVTVLLGGPSGRNRFSAANIALLAERVAALASQAGAFLLTPSRRTPASLTTTVSRALEATGRPLRVWNGTGENPYVPWMAAADAIVVTGDSVNMVGEAAAMGRPVLVHRPDALSPKITGFLDAMAAEGAILPIEDGLVTRAFAPRDATPHIAAEALRRYHLHRDALAD